MIINEEQIIQEFVLDGAVAQVRSGNNRASLLTTGRAATSCVLLF